MKKHLYTYLLLCCLCGIYPAYAQKKIKVAAIGDSVTEGFGLQNPDSASYPAVLQRLLGEAYQVENFGHSGATLLRRGYNPYAETQKFHQAIAAQADIAVIHLGLNDTDPRNFPHYRDQFVSDYLWLIDTLRAHNPTLKIHVCKMSPIFTGHPRFSSSTFGWYHQIQEMIAQVAAARQLPVIDFYGELHNRPDLFTDAPTLHPNAQGASKIAQIVQQHIRADFGGLQLPPVFGNYMVVQRDKPFHVWGRANAGTTVEVQWGGTSKNATVGADGHWQMTFSAPTLNNKPQTLLIKNEDTQYLFDQVLVGDVWLAAGQSNMEFALRHALRGDSLTAIATARDNIRLLQFDAVAHTSDIAWDSTALAKANELDFFHGEWGANNPENALRFSAVAYAFAYELSKNQDIPIGIIHLSVGGSPQLAWLPRISLESNPDFVGSLHPWRKTDYLMGWCRERANKNLSASASAFQQHPYAPSYIFEAGIAPLIPFALQGIIWYQGESDAENVELYSRLFPYFVKEWRHKWQDELPFYYVQLSSIERPSWPRFRDAQRRLLATVPNSGMAVSSDIGDPTDVHPREKIIVGQRLAQWALREVYAADAIPSGPLVDNYTVQDNTIEVTFHHAEGMCTMHGDVLQGFAFQTADGRYTPAKARIDQGKVYVQKPEDTRLTALVYGWEPIPNGNLTNTAGLPASTFRIDFEDKKDGVGSLIDKK